MKLRIEDPGTFWLKAAIVGTVALMAGYVVWLQNNPMAVYNLIYN